MTRTPADDSAPLTGSGIGLRKEHFDAIVEDRPDVAFFEAISENFMIEGGRPLSMLERVRRDYPVALHGVSLSIGSAEAVDRLYVRRLKDLVDRIQPAVVSDHLCWTALGGHNSNDLLPLPFTEEALQLVVSRISEVQDALGRQILVENVSTYLRFNDSDYSEWEFVAEAVKRSGCGLLCDVNNIYVNSVNHGFDPRVYLRALPSTAVQEIHLAGFTRKERLPVPLLIDSHSRRVSQDVWTLYADAINQFGPVPTLIEWDLDIPALEVLLEEAAHAEDILDACRALAA